MRLLILFASSLIILTSCDCVQYAAGTVIDSQTGQPIHGALVQKQNNEHDQVETDEKGYFEIRSISGGLFGCPSMTIVISQNGYKTEIVNPGEYETIKLLKIE